MLTSLNDEVRWLSWPFAAANVFSIDAWRRQVPPPRPLPAGSEPAVAVIIPTCGESVPLVLRTVTSVLEQDWPTDRLVTGFVTRSWLGLASVRQVARGAVAEPAVQPAD